MKILQKILTRFHSQLGSTIIELLVSLMIVGLVVTAIASAATHSIKNTGEARFRQVATTLGQEVIEKSRVEKNRLGFLNFANAVGTNTYCFSTIPSNFDSLSSGNCGSGDNITLAGADFERSVVFSLIPATGTPTIVRTVVTVSWQDGNNSRSVELIQEFKKVSQNF